MRNDKMLVIAGAAYYTLYGHLHGDKTGQGAALVLPLAVGYLVFM